MSWLVQTVLLIVGGFAVGFGINRLLYGDRAAPLLMLAGAGFIVMARALAV